MKRDGFSLIEIMVGMLIFVVGVMALAASTGFVSLQLQAADLRTERNVAHQQVIERLHATDFDNLASTPKASAIEIGDYRLWWDVQSLRWALKEVEVYSEGPGFESGNRVASKTDSLTVWIARPVK